MLYTGDALECLYSLCICRVLDMYYEIFPYIFTVY